MQKRRKEVENADGSTNAYLQPCATSAPIEQNAGSAPLAGAASTQGSPSEAADPSSHGQRALPHELNKPTHTGSPASPDTLEVGFALASPSVLCNFLLEQADGGNEECKKELDRILAAVDPLPLANRETKSSPGSFPALCQPHSYLKPHNLMSGCHDV
jgi:hypothetical protein